MYVRKIFFLKKIFLKSLFFRGNFTFMRHFQILNFFEKSFFKNLLGVKIFFSNLQIFHKVKMYLF